MSNEYGTIADVSTVDAGSFITTDTLAGATVLPVVDASVFDELGGQKVYTGGQVYEVTAVDIDLNTVTLLTGLVNNVAADDPLTFYPPTPVKTALVDLGGSDGELVRVAVPLTLAADLPDGERQDNPEVVLIEERTPGELYLADVVPQGTGLLGDGVDLDDYVAPGSYTQIFSAQAASGLNYPVPYAGVLDVGGRQLPLAGGVLIQRYTAYRNAFDASNPSVWVRSFGLSVWSTWRPVTGRRRWVAKSVAEGVTNSTTLQDDDELFLDLPVGMWEVNTKLTVFGSAAAADIKVAWTFSGTVSNQGRMTRGPTLLSADITDTNMRSSAHAFGTAVTYGVDATSNSYIEESMLLTVTVAGRLRMQWAESTGGVGVITTVSVGSRIVADWMD